MNPFILQETEHKEKFGSLPSIYFAMAVNESKTSLEMIKLNVDDIQHFDEHYVLLRNGFLPIIAKRNETININLSVESGV